MQNAKLRGIGIAVGVIVITGIAAFGVAWWVKSITPKASQIFIPAKPSVTRACLPTGVEEYNTKQLEQADFCSPGGEYIMELTISDRNAWTVRTHENRAAFGPVGSVQKPTIVVVSTTNNRYQFNLVR